ncbi:MAG: CPBP family intramembrane metalloprotease [Eubacterium sp.]|nr:CPBP family intramembrane metalloprotease [Eubacterium sp.]
MFRKFADLFFPVFLFLIIQLAVSFAASLFFVAAGGSGSTFFFESVEKEISLPATLISFLVIIVVQYFFRKKDGLRFQKDRLVWSVPKTAALVILTGFGAVGLNLLFAVLRLQEIFPSYSQMADLLLADQNPVLVVLTSVVFGPIAEELTYRGLLLRRAAAYMSFPAALFLSALVFAACHFNMVQLLYSFPLALLFGLLYRYSGSLLVSILAHVAANGMVFILSM